MIAPLGTQTWPVSFGGVNDTLVTGGLFIFVAYVLQPAITSAFRRVRAFHAWRAIEKSQTVEVTNYSMAAEIFGGRGKWDNARVVTVLLAMFSLASWGLELSINQASCVGNADLLHRPPPVIIGRINDTDNWQVKSRTDLDGYGVHNVFDDYALSRYYLIDGYHRDTFVNGGTISAYWSTEATTASNLFYYANGTTTTVERLPCAGDQYPERKDVFSGGTRWGAVVECEPGPSPTSNRTEDYGHQHAVAPQTILLKSADGEVFLVVAEPSNYYPRFLYSIWTAEIKDENVFELNHLFHIGATMQLAEAIVTGLVQGERSGGGCFALLRKFSESRNPYSTEVERASPFGEHPSGSHMIRLQHIEILECGLEVNANALVCLACLMWLTFLGVTSSLLLWSSGGIDVYNRDELMCALLSHGATKDSTSRSAGRTFVRKDSAGNIVVVVGDIGNAQNNCARVLGRGGTVVESTCRTKTTMSAQSNKSSGGVAVTEAVDRADTAVAVTPSSVGFVGAVAILPEGPWTVYSEEARTGMANTLPGSNDVFCYPTSVP